MQGYVGGIGHDETKRLYMFRQLASSTNFIRSAKWFNDNFPKVSEWDKD